MRSCILLTAVSISLLAMAGCSHGSGHSHGSEATAQQSAHGHAPGDAPANPPANAVGDASQPTPVDIQGADEWKRSPQMHRYYDLTVATFSKGTDIDVDAYEAQSFAIFREFARANGTSEEAMIDHLKLIPRQVVGIVKEDPTVLKDYDTFWAALAGPD